MIAQQAAVKARLAFDQVDGIVRIAREEFTTKEAEVDAMRRARVDAARTAAVLKLEKV